MRAHALDQLLIVGLGFLIADFIPPAAIAQAAPARINLAIVRGEDVIYDNGSSATSDIAVRVEDDDHRPISGASVEFALPISGASGIFFNNSLTMATLTGRDGLAIVRKLKVNTVPGKFMIYVTASYGSLRTETFITQFIKERSPGAKPHDLRSRTGAGKWKWIVLAAAAAGAAGGSIYYLSARGSSGTPISGGSAISPISVSTGPVLFGSPR